MIKKLLILLAILITSVLLYAALKSPNWVVSRELVVIAPAASVFPHINNSKLMNDWMPWQASDPSSRIRYSGPPEGVGSKSSWESEGPMGVGSSVIVESLPNRSVKSQIDYVKPMVMSQEAEVILVAEGQGTRITWRASGRSNFVFRLMSIFVNVDKLVGSEFARGLAQLKKIVETKK